MMTFKHSGGPYVMPTLEEIEDAALNDALGLRDMMRDLVGQLWGKVEAEIHARALMAQEKGMRLAVSPMVTGDMDATRDVRKPYVFSVKYDTKMLKPGEPAPAGWTIYEVRK